MADFERELLEARREAEQAAYEREVLPGLRAEQAQQELKDKLEEERRNLLRQREEEVDMLINPLKGRVDQLMRALGSVQWGGYGFYFKKNVKVDQYTIGDKCTQTVRDPDLLAEWEVGITRVCHYASEPSWLVLRAPSDVRENPYGRFFKKHYLQISSSEDFHLSAYRGFNDGVLNFSAGPYKTDVAEGNELKGMFKELFVAGPTRHLYQLQTGDTRIG